MTVPMSSGLRTVGGILFLVCGAGYAVAYYLTQGFFHVDGLDQFAQLQYGGISTSFVPVFHRQ